MMPAITPFQGFFEDNPQVGYFSYANQFGQGQNQKNWAQNQFADVQNRYQGVLGQQIRNNQAPDLSFTDFLSQYFAPGGGMQQQWGAMAPQQRGFNQSQFAPPTRWML